MNEDKLNRDCDKCDAIELMDRYTIHNTPPQTHSIAEAIKCELENGEMSG